MSSRAPGLSIVADCRVTVALTITPAVESDAGKIASRLEGRKAAGPWKIAWLAVICPVKAQADAPPGSTLSIATVPGPVMRPPGEPKLTLSCGPGAVRAGSCAALTLIQS